LTPGISSYDTDYGQKSAIEAIEDSASVWLLFWVLNFELRILSRGWCTLRFPSFINMSLVCTTLLFTHPNADLVHPDRPFLYQITWKRTFSAMSSLATSYHVKSASNASWLVFSTEHVWNSRSAKERMEKASTRTRAKRKTSSKAIRKSRCVFHRQVAQRVDQRSKTQENAESSSSPAKLAKMQQTAERRQKKQKRKAQEGKLQVKRQEMDKAKVSLGRSFLSGISLNRGRCRMR
jgi:hypothetical protein